MVAVAYGGLRHLRDQRLRVAQQQNLQGAATFEFLLHDRSPQPVALAAALHNGAARRRLAAHEERDPDYAVVADDGDLGRSAVLQYIEERNDRATREIQVALGTARFVHRRSKRQR